MSHFASTTDCFIRKHWFTSPFRFFLHRPPELFSDNIVSPAVDIYSFGVLLLFMLAGQEPYGGLTYGRIVSHKMSFSDEQLKLPDALQTSTNPKVVAIMELVRVCTQWDRKKRPSAEEVIEALRQLLTTETAAEDVNTPIVPRE